VTIRLLLADDQQLVRAGFRLILTGEPDIDVIAEAADGASTVATARRLRPDVTLKDVRMPGMDGISATRQLLANKPAPTRVIVLTTFDVDSYIYDALRAGASGFLLKNVPPEELIHAIHVVAAGEALLDPAVTLRVIEEFSRTPTRRPPPPESKEEKPLSRKFEMATHPGRATLRLNAVGCVRAMRRSAKKRTACRCE
jgi:DNA-binding NarL/FixJ family response regulator